MARQLKTGKRHETGRTITTKTPYGTTSDMVITDDEILSKVNTPEDHVLVYDDAGYYFTPKNRVDTNLADPCRYDINHRELFNDLIVNALSNSK